VVAEVKEIRSVSNRPVQQFDVARFNLEKPDMKFSKQYQFKILNRFASFENLGNNTDINIRGNIKIYGYL